MKRRIARTLVEDAYRFLESGPRSGEELAERVLRLTGSGSAPSAAIRTLLGADARFQMDEAGRWRLSPNAGLPGTPLRALEYAVVDVETTGGRYEGGHRITEIAIVEVSGGSVQESWHTLVHPGRHISRFVQGLTGITEETVTAAPFFEDIAEDVLKRLEGQVFVAHNVRFDWGFVTRELASALGEVPSCSRLCTVRLARHLAPELRHRSLDGLADHFGIPIFDRHRAHGDALATARVLVRLLDRATGLGISDLAALYAYLKRPRAARAAGSHLSQEELF